MKTNKLSIFIALLGIFMLALPACQPDEFEMGDIISKEALKYSITQNAEDPNMIILKSENPGLNPMWVTPMGRSVRVQDTLYIPFEGDYKFVYGVQSAGGFVQADTFFLTLTTSNLNYVNDPLWTFLTGGVGEEKTWIFDNGEYGQAAGPLAFVDPASGPAFENYVINWDPGKMPPGSTDENMGWNSTMTFSLKGGAIFTAEKFNEGGTEENPKLESGTYFLNAAAKTLDITDGNLLRPDNFIENAENWNSGIKILELNDNQFRVVIMRTNDEGPWYYLLNYVSKDYADNYVPEDLPEPEPQLPDGWQDDVSQVVSTTITWKLSETTPLNWANLDGSLMNEWNAPEDYPGWLGVHDLSVYEGFSLAMNSEDNSLVYVAPDGTEQEGTFTLDDKGIYTFDGISPSFPVIGWASFNLTAENQLRILSIAKNSTGAVSGMWVGAKDPDPDKNEYMAYLLVPSMGESSEPDPEQAVFNILTSKTWKLDSERTYDVTTSWGAEQGPVIFSDYSSWSYNPLPGEQYGAGEADVDYGTMSFSQDGSVVVNQRVRKYSYIEEGETLERSGSPVEGDVLDSDEVEVLNGTWSFDYETMELTMSVGMLHPWTADYAVADWGDTKIYKIQNGALLMQVMRSEELSGEGAMPMTYVFVPVVE